jgi:arginine decarboxylase
LNTKVATTAQVREPADRWTIGDAAELYDVASWGKGYFSVGENGNLLVHPTKEPNRSIDLKQLVDTLEWRGISLPILIRFADILKQRLREMYQAFDVSIREHGYQADYCCVYPIKVNQQRQVVEEIFNFGRAYHFGLEAGSKPCWPLRTTRPPSSATASKMTSTSKW